MKIPQDTDLEYYTGTRDIFILLFLSLNIRNTCMQVPSSQLALHKLFSSTARGTWKKFLLSSGPSPPTKTPWNSILQPRLEMSRCNQISDPSPLGPCQCFRESQDHSINHLDNCLNALSHSLLCHTTTQSSNTVSCPSCFMSVMTRAFHT